MKKRFLFINILIFFALIFVSVSQSFASVGQIAAIRGNASALKNDETRALKIKSKIFLNDTIVTDTRTRLQILFNDESIVSMGPESKMTVKKFKFDKNDAEFETESEEGIFRIMGGKIVNRSPDNFNINTSVASIGIRGSAFAFKISESELNIVFLGGKGIDVKSEFGDVALVKPGFGTKVSNELKKIEAPRKFSENEMKSLDTDPESGSEDSKSSDDSASGEQKSQDEKDQETAEDQDSEQAQDSEATDSEPISDYSSDTTESSGFLNTDEISSGISSDRNQDNLNQEIEENTKETFKFSSGKYLESASDMSDALSAENFIRKGTLSGVFDEYLKITAKDSNQNIISQNQYQSFSVPDSSKNYSFPEPVTCSYAFTKDGYTYDLSTQITTSALNEFYVLHTPETALFSNNPDYLYSSTGYFGILSDSSDYPGTEIYRYNGFFTAAAETITNSNEYIESVSGNFEMGVNFTNKKLMGAFYEKNDENDHGAPLFFFGSVSDDNQGIKNLVVIGSKTGDPDGSYPADFPVLTSIYSESGTGSFYGSKYQGIGMNSSAGLYDFKDLSDTGSAGLTMAGFRSTQPEEFLKSDPYELSGFAIGIAENIEQPESGKRVLLNYFPENFKLSLNPEQGIVSGSMSAEDISGSGQKLSGIGIGGTDTNSSYIADDVFIALMHGTDTISDSTETYKSSVKDKTAYLVTENTDSQHGEYLTWGYWEIAYDDPEDQTKTYHIHVPGSMWVAGSPTPETVLSEYASSNTILTYSGITKSVTLDQQGHIYQNPEGSFTMEADLYNSDISGVIEFPDDTGTIVNLPFNGAYTSGVIEGDFPDSISGSTINGRFYGPDAENTAGNFSVDQTDVSHHGIFMGTKQ